MPSLRRVLIGISLSFFMPGVTMAERPESCPVPPIMMAGANMNVTEHDSRKPIVIAWDRAVDMVPFIDPKTGKKGTAPYDFRPFLNNMNIAGGRYGLGTLLAGEGGLGGAVRWEGAQMVITPEAPFEPGTQYVIWVYKFISIDGVQCPRLGNRLFFKTAGEAPNDGNPVRGVNLAAVWRGNSSGAQRLTGTIAGVHPVLNIVSIDTRELGAITIVADEGSLIMKGERMLARTDLKPGDGVQAEFYGDRLTWILVK